MTTPRGGQHIYFPATPGIKSASAVLGKGVDSRNEGGYIIAPGSVMADGRRYTTLVEGSGLGSGARLPDMPEALAEALRNPKRSMKARAGNGEGADSAARDAGERIFGDKVPLFGTQEFLDGFNSLAATLDPNNRDDWINLGMWLKGAYGDQARDLWIEWAMTAEKPDDEVEQEKRWNGFKPTKADARSFWKKVCATQDGFVEAAVKKLCQKYYLVTHAGKTAFWRRGYNADLKREEWVELSEPDLKRECHYSKAVRRFIYNPKKPFYPNGFYFDPTTTNWENGAINLWTGWAITPNAKPWPTIEYHLRDVLASGDEEHYRYILNWGAFYVQNPDRAAEVALVFRGSKGVGKGMLGRALCSLAPAHSIQVSHSSQVTGRFNEHMHQTIMFFADEAFWAGDKAGEGQLKRMITEDTLVIEGKNKKIIKARNLLHIIIASNEDWVVPSSKGERRYAIFGVSDQMKGKEAYFKRLAEAYSGEEMQGFLHYLLNIDLGDWHPRSNVPVTAALFEQAEISEALAPEAAIRRWLNRGVLPGTNAALGDANVLLLPWALHDATGIRVNKTNLPLALRKIATVGRKWVDVGEDGRTKRRQVTAYEFPTLAEARAMFDPKYPWDQTVSEWQCEFDAADASPLPEEF